MAIFFVYISEGHILKDPEHFETVNSFDFGV